MKSLTTYINEAKAPKDEIDKALVELSALAMEKGASITFRDRKTNTGDFCIFIYTGRQKGRYEVGFDGDWDGKEHNFDNCVKQAKEWLKKYENIKK